jgi:uncharacterized membrane protein
MNARIFTDAMQLFPVVLIGFVLPWLGRTRRGLLFGVTVPLEFAASDTAAAAMRRYRTSTLIVAAVVTAAVVVAMCIGTQVRTMAQIAVVIELVAAMVCWQRERRLMLPHGIVVPLERSAGLTPNRHAGAMLATASAMLPLTATGLCLRAHWSQIPARWPQHWNAAGEINGWGVRTPVGVYLPLVMGLVVIMPFVAMVGFMAYAPAAQSRQRGRILAPMAGLAWALALFFCTIALLPLLHLTTVGPIVVLVVLHMLLVLGIVVWMVVRCGFMAPDTIAKQAIEPYDGTDDRFWRGGVLYYNPNDAAVMVPKRYGWGWTLNFARPTAWVFSAAIVGIAMLSILLPRLLR